MAEQKLRSMCYHGEIPVSVSLLTPASRMILVHLSATRNYDEGQWDDEGQKWIVMPPPTLTCSISPVLAIETRIVRVYSKMSYTYEDFYDPGLTHRAALSAGWRYHGLCIRHGVIINNNRFGLLRDAEMRDNNSDDEIWPVVCSWPEAEDFTRIRPFLERHVIFMRTDEGNLDPHTEKDEIRKQQIHPNEVQPAIQRLYDENS